MNHKISTVVVLLSLLIFGSYFALGYLTSGEIDAVCDNDNNTLFRYNGTWGCANLMDSAIFNFTVNNITNVYNNYSLYSNMSSYAENLVGGVPDIWVNETGDTMSGQLVVQSGNGKIVTTGSSGSIDVQTSAGQAGAISFGNTADIGISQDGVSNGYDYDGSFIFKQKASNPDGIGEFIWIEEGGDWRFALPSSGVNYATYNPRSMIIAGSSWNNGSNFNCSLWGFDELKCDTSGVGADLGVQNDLQVLNNTYVGNNIYADGNSSTQEVESRGRLVVGGDVSDTFGALADTTRMTINCNQSASYCVYVNNSGKANMWYYDGGFGAFSRATTFYRVSNADLNFEIDNDGVNTGAEFSFKDLDANQWMMFLNPLYRTVSIGNYTALNLRQNQYTFTVNTTNLANKESRFEGGGLIVDENLTRSDSKFYNDSDTEYWDTGGKGWCIGNISQCV